MSDGIGCPNCGGGAASALRSVLVTKKRIPARLCHCTDCDFLFLQNPTWLDVAYEDEFYGDTGHVQRNLQISSFLQLLMLLAKDHPKRDISLEACDIGTGLGLLPRLMRDSGFNFVGCDAYSKMSLIQPFTCQSSKGYPIKTAFEVIEHIESTHKFLTEEIGKPDIFIFSTLFRPDDMVPGDGWGYFAFENGQHISFHSKRSFRSAMMRASIPAEYLFSFNAGLHVLAIRSPWQQIVRKAGEILRSRQAQAVVAALSQRYRTDPLTQPDHIHAMKLVRMNQPTANPAPDTSV